MRVLTSLLITSPIAAAAPPTAELVRDRALFQGQVDAIFGRESRAARLAAAALKTMSNDARMVVISASFGRFATLSSEEDRTAIFLRADGGVFCYSDTDCPPGADEDADDPRPGEEPGYHLQVDMGAPAFIGQGELLLLPLPSPDDVGLVVGWSSHDSARGRYELVRVRRDAVQLGRPLVRVDRFQDMDGDGKVDGIVTRHGVGNFGESGGARDLLFGDGRGHFVSDVRRARAFHSAELASALAALEAPGAFEALEDETTSSLVAPVLRAYGVAAVGRLPARRLRAAADRWVAALPKALGLSPGDEDERLLAAQGVLRCLGKATPTVARLLKCTSLLEE